MSDGLKQNLSLATVIRPSLSYCIPPFVIIICSSFVDQLNTGINALTYLLCFAVGSSAAFMFVGIVQVLDHFISYEWRLAKNPFRVHKITGAFILPIGVIGLFPAYFDSLQFNIPVAACYSMIVLALMFLKWDKWY